MACDPGCIDTYDERRFRTAVVGLLTCLSNYLEPTEQPVTATSLLVTGDTTIPADFIQASIFISTGTADIDGVTYPTGSTLNLPPMSFGATDRLYPAIEITNVTGNVILFYTERV